MQTFDRITALRAQVAKWRVDGEQVALVPTLGNLHDGHQSLMDMARAKADYVVASIFVNPTQFGLGEDYQNYPRTLDSDMAKLKESGVDALFSPLVQEVYPNGYEHSSLVEVPVLSDILCGAARPGHFRGVATVVCKLFNMVLPDIAVFGEKDWQQLMVIRQMVSDLALPVQIYGAPTERDHDGLALSSRNQYLTPEQRAVAPNVFATMSQAAARIRGGNRDFETLEREALAALVEDGFKTDYFTIRRAEDLLPPKAGDAKDVLRVFAAVWLGKARLIDNLSVT